MTQRPGNRADGADTGTPVVLVVYATRNGGTAEIADWIGTALADGGVDALVRPAAAVRDLPPVRAVVLGSGLYGGRWLREATRFARRHRRALASLPVWLFSSGPLDASAAAGDLPPTPAVRHLADRVDAAGHMTFGGRLVPGARGPLARMILARGQGGDYRDPERIGAWVRDIAAQVRAAADQPTR
ncbi:flavodoxin domain-containing protein [Streptomyces sp. NPDC020983]|uniref:flavodoxin domain-containing protein n=1 Tax=Streptomyces sp. NPDC020983 TaxID=3365106 RepID=UPI0037B9EEE3